MKKLFAGLVAGALLLLGTSAASAQTDTPPDLTGVQQANVHPLQIEGIQIMEPGRYSLNTESVFVGAGKPHKPFNLYLKPGVHELAPSDGEYANVWSNTNVFYAPGAILYVPPGSGLVLRDGTQLIGPGPGKGTRTVFAGAAFFATYGVTISGHDVGLEIRNQTDVSDIHQPGRYSGMLVLLGRPGYNDAGAVVYGAQITNNGIGILMKETALADMPTGELQIHWSVFGNNGQNTDIDLEASRVSLEMTTTRLLAPGREVPFNIRGASLVNPVRFADCLFSANPWEVPSFVERFGDGGVVFSETRPSLADPVMVRLFPREVLLRATDFTGSGEVNVEDVVLLGQAFGNLRDSVAFGRLYDLNEDGMVNLPDVVELAYAFAGVERSQPVAALSASPRMPEFLATITQFPPVVEAARTDAEFGPIITDFLQPTAVAEVSGETPNSFSLGQNYPNPFNANTIIRFELEQDGLAQLSVYNVAGQLVRMLTDARLSAGVYTEMWDGRDNLGVHAGSGVYLYRLQSEAGMLVRMLALVR